MRKLITLAVVALAVWYSRANSGERPTPPHGFSYDEPATATRPILTYYVADGDWCQPCNTAKRELKAARDLPFDVVYQTQHPKWVTTLPTAHWQTDHDGDRQYVGWPGVKPLVEMFERSRTKAAGTRHDVANKPAAVSRLPAGYHTHTCRVDGTRWGHVAGGSHNCPKCGRLEYRKD